MALVLPVGNARVSSSFQGGYRSTGGHSGTDYAVAQGTPIASAAAGTVVSAGYEGAYGYRVVVQHSNGTRTAYSHMSHLGAQAGQQVGAGQFIGNVGSTGNSTGPHLHFEVFVGGQMVNPEDWLAGASTPSGGDYWADQGPMSITTTGRRITPVQEEAAWESPNQVDMTAADSRFGYAASDARFGMTAEESRSIQQSVSGDETPMGEQAEAEVVIDSQVTEGGWQRMPGGMSASGAPTNGPYDYQRSFELARSVGASESEARMLASVVAPESGGNPSAHNPNASTGDNSFGLWQINMLGPMGTERRRQFGLQRNEELFDPRTNANAALNILRSQGPTAWTTWGG